MCALLAGAALIAACSGGDEGAPAPSAASSDGASADAGFPTGPAVLVPAGFQFSSERVDSTGAYVPANGKPTLVFVDAIW